jgi:hypothetical protein
MRPENTARFAQSPPRTTGIVEYIIYVSIALVLMAGAGKLALSLYPENSDFRGTESVASETFKHYSQKLEELSKQYSKGLDRAKHVN